MIATLDAVPPIVVLAAQRTQRFEQGVVGFRLHRVFDVHAGPSHRHDDLLFAGIYEDGRVLKVRILHDEIGGREADEATKAQTAYKYEHPAPLDVFDRPYDPAHLSDYRYDAPQGNRVAFHALVRDAAHGDGSFTVDAQGNAVSVQYAPCVMPQYAHSGDVRDDRAQVLPGYWALTRETQQYSGRYLFFSGGANVVIEQSNFVRFPNEAAAIAALDAGRI